MDVLNLKFPNSIQLPDVEPIEFILCKNVRGEVLISFFPGTLNMHVLWESKIFSICVTSYVESPESALHEKS